MLAFLQGDTSEIANPQKLRDLAVWYREYAERTQNTTIWEARLRTAEELELNAAALEAEASRSAGRST